MYVVLKFIDNGIYLSSILYMSVCVCVYTIHMCWSIHLSASACIPILVREMFKCSYSYVIFLLVDHSAGGELVTVAEGTCVGS